MRAADESHTLARKCVKNARELTKSRLYTLYSTGRDLSATYRDVRQNRADFLDAWLYTATSGKKTISR